MRLSLISRAHPRRLLRFSLNINVNNFLHFVLDFFANSVILLSMKTNTFGTLKWNISELAASMHISESEALEFFQDGRRLAFLLEYRIAKVFGGKRSDSERLPYDVVCGEGHGWEVRSLTKSGLHFAPSNTIGSGRSFSEDALYSKLESNHGYVICDAMTFPHVTYWCVSVETIRAWYDAGKLGSRAHVSHKRALELLSEEFNA